MKRIQEKLTFANVVACMALFVALGGVSYAAVKLPADSVGTSQIRNNAVTPVKLSPKAKKALKGATGPAGDTGPRGPEGERGSQGAAGIAGIVTRYGPVRNPPTTAFALSYAACHAGESATGGGWAFVGTSRPANNTYSMIANRPALEIPASGAEPSRLLTPEDGGKATGWIVAFQNDTGSDFEFQAFVQCAAP